MTMDGDVFPYQEYMYKVSVNRNKYPENRTKKDDLTLFPVIGTWYPVENNKCIYHLFS